MNLSTIKLVALLGFALIVIQLMHPSEATKYKTLKKLKKIEKYLFGPKSKRLYPIPIPMPIPVMVKKHPPPSYTKFSLVPQSPYLAASNNYELYTAQTESQGLVKRPVGTQRPDSVAGSSAKHQQERLVNKLAQGSVLASVINQVYGDPQEVMGKLLNGRNKILKSPGSFLANLRPSMELVHQGHKQQELTTGDNQVEDYEDTSSKPRGPYPSSVSEKIPGRIPPPAEQMHTSPSANLYHHHHHHHRIIQTSPNQLHHHHQHPPAPLAPYMLTNLPQAASGSNFAAHELQPIVYGDLVPVVPFEGYQSQADMGQPQLAASEIQLARTNAMALEAHRQFGLPTQLGLINF